MEKKIILEFWFGELRCMEKIWIFFFIVTDFGCKTQGILWKKWLCDTYHVDNIRYEMKTIF
jgi:hypothetical protein